MFKVLLGCILNAKAIFKVLPVCIVQLQLDKDFKVFYCKHKFFHPSLLLLRKHLLLCF